jgi:hypothetical protein
MFGLPVTPDVPVRFPVHDVGILQLRIVKRIPVTVALLMFIVDDAFDKSTSSIVPPIAVVPSKSVGVVPPAKMLPPVHRHNWLPEINCPVAANFTVQFCHVEVFGVMVAVPVPLNWNEQLSIRLPEPQVSPAADVLDEMNVTP